MQGDTVRYIPNTKCIRKHSVTGYEIFKQLNGKWTYLGRGKTLIIALMKRDWCEANNWKPYAQSHHEKPPEVTCTGRGNPGFPASTRERPRETFFNTSRGQIPLPWLGSSDALPFALAWRPYFPGAPREAH